MKSVRNFEPLRGLSDVLAIMVVLLIVGTGISVLAGEAPSLAKLDIVSVNRMEVVKTNDSFLLRLRVTFRNRASQAIRFRNAAFGTTLRRGDSAGASPLLLGEGRLEDLVVPAASGRRSGFASAEIGVRLGPDDSATVARAMALWNVVGDPASAPVLGLVGTAEIGRWESAGWLFQGTNRVAADLEFRSSTQREVLLY